MNVEELPGAVPSVAAKEADEFESVSIEDLHLLVAAVRHIEELLLFVGRERDIKRGAFRRRRLALDEALLNESTVGPEDLNAVVNAVAYVDQVVVRDA